MNDVSGDIFDTIGLFYLCLFDGLISSDFRIVVTVEPLLYDHPQNHIGVVV